LVHIFIKTQDYRRHPWNLERARKSEAPNTSFTSWSSASGCKPSLGHGWALGKASSLVSVWHGLDPSNTIMFVQCSAPSRGY
jgi:hypothetical protein